MESFNVIDLLLCNESAEPLFRDGFGAAATERYGSVAAHTGFSVLVIFAIGEGGWIPTRALLLVNGAILTCAAVQTRTSSVLDRL